MSLHLLTTAGERHAVPCPALPLPTWPDMDHAVGPERPCRQCGEWKALDGYSMANLRPVWRRRNARWEQPRYLCRACERKWRRVREGRAVSKRYAHEAQSTPIGPS